MPKIKDVDFKVGQLVCSTAGRDKGKLYLVIGSAEDNRVWVADGSVRRVENPKKKNIKHLRKLPFIAGIPAGGKIRNGDIRDSITKYRESSESV
ncbi:ribosomal protein L14E/L6E/L27E [Desulfohalotomaculum tongense]|uniref:KOW domain-containing RNA-binding protein n=1 Tax=Desulforadius tongensis TaxID=1216062 RepID=UPI001EE5D383|nr:KOW domain-containing RNA-binding protein [Desulforadius tongensis]MBM7853848.1 ribosomal protein L14E/L6E/L27E [Desulforadius tongensis]